MHCNQVRSVELSLHGVGEARQRGSRPCQLLGWAMFFQSRRAYNSKSTTTWHGKDGRCDWLVDFFVDCLMFLFSCLIGWLTLTDLIWITFALVFTWFWIDSNTRWWFCREGGRNVTLVTSTGSLQTLLAFAAERSFEHIRTQSPN